MKLDALILTKKAEISAVSAAQLANGKITSTVYLIQLNDEMAARLNLKIHEIKKINPLLRSAGLIGEKPYNSMPIKRLTMGVESILGSEDMSDQTAESLAMILDIIDHKLEGDNPEVLLVTDW